MYDEKDLKVLKTLSNKIHTENVVWIVIATFQIISIVGIPVGIYNLIVSISGIDASRRILEHPSGVVAAFEPLTGSIVVLCINLFFGACIGIIGSLYHIFGVRGYALAHRDSLERIEAAYRSGCYQAPA